MNVIAKVPLLRESMASDGVRVTALPPWLGPAPTNRMGRYWHRPRSAYRSLDGVLHVSVWCGPSFYVGSPRHNPYQFTDDPPEDLRCGTCEGRWLGARREDGLIFSPRDIFAPPKRCPGESYDATLRHCALCGAKVNAGWRYGMAIHRPGPDLAVRYRPCNRHGWERMQPLFDRVAHAYTDVLACLWHSCDYVCEPRS